MKTVYEAKIEWLKDNKFVSKPFDNEDDADAFILEMLKIYPGNAKARIVEHYLD